MSLRENNNFQSKPNVIFILTDDQGYGDFSCHGNPLLETPNLDRLYHQSICFTDFHVSPICTPTRGQLMSGCDALKNGATYVNQGRSLMRTDIPIMPEIFSESGYKTAHFGKWHLGDSYPFRPQDRGFHETLHHGAFGITSIADYWGNDYWNDTFEHNGELKKYSGYCTDIWFKEAMKWMEEQYISNSPFFCYLATNCPHWPHWVDKKYSEPYEIEDVPAKFFGQIANLDENIGKLMIWMDKIGLTDNSILIYMTDNGTTAGQDIFNAGMKGHKFSLFEGGHRVPFFIRWPAANLKDHREIEDLIQAQDLLPTLIDLCNLNTPDNENFDGLSFSNLFNKDENNDEKLLDRMLVVQFGFEPKKWDATVMWKKWRLVQGDKLYNISDDPHQNNNIFEKFPEIVKAMRDHYEKWWVQAFEEFNKIKYIHIGSEISNPMKLHSCDWHGSYADNFENLYAGDHIGYWDIIVENAGKYEIQLYRWPIEANTPLRAGITGPNGTVEGIPIAKARLKIGDIDLSSSINESDTHVTFNVDLEKGKNRLQTWFNDKDENQLCSAYQTRVFKKD